MMQHTNAIPRSVRIDLLLECFARHEQESKKTGAFAHAEGVRWCITHMLRIADEGDPPLDQSE